MNNYNFDILLNRIGSNCFKWDGRKRFLGNSNLLPMHVADMDFACAPEILNAIQERAAHPSFGYAMHSQYHFELLAHWLFKNQNWNISPAWCLHSPSSISSLSMCIFALTNENDGVIIQTPVYPPFMDTIRNNNRKILVNRLYQGKYGQYQIDFVNFEDLCAQENTKLFILCSPHNPVGRVWTKSELLRISEICLKHNVKIIADELHGDLVYPDYMHIPIASLDKEISNITVTCTSPSKTFNLAGLACSAIIAECKNMRTKIFEATVRFHLELPQVFSVAAFLVSYEKGENWHKELMRYLDENRKFLTNWIESHLLHVKVTEIQATYLAWLNFKSLKKNDSDLKKLMYEKGCIALDSGSKFGMGGEGFMRLNFGCPRSQLKDALERISIAINSSC